MSRFLKRFTLLLWWFFAVCLISAALLLGMARLILPSLGSYRGEVESWLGEYLQHGVSIDSLDLRWHGLGPQLTLTGLQVTEPVADTPIFRVRNAYLDTDLWNLMLGHESVVRNIDLAGLEVQLDIREDGSVAARGVELWRPGATGSGKLTGGVLAVLAVPRRITLSDVTLWVRRGSAH